MPNEVAKPDKYDAEDLSTALFCNHFILDQATLNASMDMQKGVVLLERAMKLMEEVEKRERPKDDE